MYSRAGEALAMLASVAFTIALVFWGPVTARAAQFGPPSYQPEARNSAGVLTVESAFIRQVLCTGSGENGRRIFLYQYNKRPPGYPAFRAISPPDWSHALGGRDFPTYQEAVNAACVDCEHMVPPCRGVCLLGVCSDSPR